MAKQKYCEFCVGKQLFRRCLYSGYLISTLIKRHTSGIKQAKVVTYMGWFSYKRHNGKIHCTCKGIILLDSLHIGASKGVLNSIRTVIQKEHIPGAFWQLPWILFPFLFPHTSLTLKNRKEGWMAKQQLKWQNTNVLGEMRLKNTSRVKPHSPLQTACLLTAQSLTDYSLAPDYVSL